MEGLVRPQFGSSTRAPPARVQVREAALRLVPLVVLALAALGVFAFIGWFAMRRFFTIDEYQWGHATWLVSTGQVPYRDFYEHHLPLGYLLHALVLPENSSFAVRALSLRGIALLYIVAGSGMLALATYLTGRDPHQALVCMILPASVGFGLMSAIDYRGDNWAAFALLGCFSALEIHRARRSPSWAVAAGLCFSCAILMTQKAVLLAGPAVALMLLATVLQRPLSRWRAWLPVHAWVMYSPLAFCLAAAAPLAAFVVSMVASGQLGRVYEITVIQALEHERIYPRFSAWKYVEPYLAYAPVTSAALAAGAFGYLVRGGRGFWTLPTLGAIVGSMLIKAPYPYNFVLVSSLLGLCAARGYGLALGWLARRHPARTRFVPALWGLPLLVVPGQLGFVGRTSTNLDQLETLRRVEAHSGPRDVVIDSEGSALFRPHRSYHWYQGAAHVQLFGDYYRGPFLEDLRRSRAPLWINGFRTAQLPQQAQRYLLDHYVQLRGDLFALGFRFPANTAQVTAEHRFEVMRSGLYFLATLEGTGTAEAKAGGWTLDGRVVKGAVELGIGWHELRAAPESPASRLSLLPPAAFDDQRHVARHAPLFEYDRAW